MPDAPKAVSVQALQNPAGIVPVPGDPKAVFARVRPGPAGIVPVPGGPRAVFAQVRPDPAVILLKPDNPQGVVTDIPQPGLVHDQQMPGDLREDFAPPLRALEVTAPIPDGRTAAFETGRPGRTATNPTLPVPPQAIVVPPSAPVPEANVRAVRIRDRARVLPLGLRGNPANQPAVIVLPADVLRESAPGPDQTGNLLLFTSQRFPSCSCLVLVT